MGMKNISFLEQHAEKIVLGVAVAGAAFMGFLAMQPVSIEGEGGQVIKPGNVEQAIAEELDKVRQAQEKLAQNPAPKVKNFVQEYQTLAQGQPLESALVSMAVVPFGPRHVPLGPVDVVRSDIQIAAPTPVGPELDKDPEKIAMENRLLRAQALVVQVNKDIPAAAAGQPVALEPGKQLITRGENVVVIDGYVAVGDMILEMLRQQQQDPKKALPPALQEAVIYRIEVLRKEQLPGGGWSEMKKLEPTKGSAAPVEIAWDANADMVQRLNDVKADFKAIMLPDYYRKEDGLPLTPPILARVVPPAIETRIKDLSQKIEELKTGVRTVGQPGILQPATTGPAGMQWPTTVEAIRALPVQPFTFWDDAVLPDHKYQYYVRVLFVNPVFGLQGAADKQLQKEPLLALKDPVPVPGIVTVHSDLAFFIQGMGGMGGGNVSGEIYKQDNGRWFFAPFDAPVGAPIEVNMKLGSGPNVNVSTKYTIVDFIRGTQRDSGYVVLRDPSGELVTREVPADWNQPSRAALKAKAQADAKAAAEAAAAAAAAAGAATPAPTTPVVTTGPATRGSRTPVPVNPPRGRQGP